MQTQQIQNRISAPNGALFGDLLQSAAKAMMQDANTYRKRKKPMWARFKAKIEYSDGNAYPMFSLDWEKYYENGIPYGMDNERLGLMMLRLWVLKCHDQGLIKSIKIYATLNPKKDTKIMDYDVRILSWDVRQGIDAYDKCISPEVRFFQSNGKCNLERLKELHIAQQMKGGNK